MDWNTLVVCLTVLVGLLITRAAVTEVFAK
jgi:hypothetical protein